MQGEGRFDEGNPAHRGSAMEKRIMSPMIPKARIETVPILAPRAKRRHSMKRQGGPRRIPTAWTRTGMASPASRFHEGDDPFCGLPPRFPGRHFLCRRSADRFRNKPGPCALSDSRGKVLPLSPRDDGWPPFVDVAAMDQCRERRVAPRSLTRSAGRKNATDAPARDHLRKLPFMDSF